MRCGRCNRSTWISTDGILTMRTELPAPKYEKVNVREQFYNKVLSDIRGLPGVTGAAYSSGLPMRWRGGIWPVIVTGSTATRATAIPQACASLRQIFSRPGNIHPAGTQRQRKRYGRPTMGCRGKPIHGEALLA